MDVFIRNKPYTGKLQAAVMDWAGTTVDYGCIGPVAVFMDVFARHGVEVTLAEARAPMGLMKKDHLRAMCGMKDVAARWEKVHGCPPIEADVAAMFGQLEPMMVAAIAKHSDPIPGTVQAVAEFRRQGLKIGTCTGYTRPMMEVLAPEAAGKGYNPDAVICSSDVPLGRPYPYMCYLNAIQLQTYPLEAMVKIGDTVADVQEGLNAGMWTIGLTKTGNEIGLSEDKIRDLHESDLEKRLLEVETRFEAAGVHYMVEGIWGCPAIIERINERLALGERPLDG